MGDAGSDLYKDKAIVEINKFHNLMVGKSELLVNPLEGLDSHKVLMTFRGESGVVITNISDQNQKIDYKSSLPDGIYTEKITGTKVTVANSKLATTIPARSVFVLYDAESLAKDEEKAQIKFIKPDNWNENIHAYIYDEEADTVVGPWLGLTMTKDKDNLFSVQLDNKLVNDKLRVIFTDGEHQSPGKNKVGYKFIDGKTYNISGIVEAPETNKIILNWEVKQSNDVDEKDYTVESYKEFSAKLEAAKKAQADQYASQDEIDKATDELNVARESLVKLANKEVLNKTIEAAKVVDEKSYTTESYTAMKTALENAVKAQENPSISQKEVNEATINLNDAISKLEAIKVVDKNVLEKSIEAGKLVKKDDYTAESFEILTKAIAVSEEILANNEATQEQINQATISLNEALAQLVVPTFEVNKDVLSKILEATAKIKKNDYTDESVSNLNKAEDLAKKIFANKDASQEQVDMAVIDLNNALIALDKKVITPEVNKEVLRELLAKSSSIDKNLYTDKSIESLDTVIKEAKKDIKDQDVTQ